MTDATDFQSTDFQPADLELHRDFLRRLARALVRLPAGSVVIGSVLDADYGVHAALEGVDGQLGLAELAPGEWFLELESKRFAPLLVPFSIQSGARTRLELALEPAVQRSLAFAVHGQDWNWMRITLQEAHGRRLVTRWLERGSVPQPSSGPNLVLELPVGTFEVEVETDTGLALRAGFDVTALVPQDSALAFELR